MPPAATRNGAQMAEFLALPRPQPERLEAAAWIRSASTATSTTTLMWSSLLAAFSVILLSEIGDKTFFIAALLCMRHNAFTVFVGALGALALMTCLSVAAGSALPLLLRPVITHWAATVLFFFFGAKLLYEVARQKVASTKDEMEEVEAELALMGDDSDKHSPTTGRSRNPAAVGGASRFVLFKLFRDLFSPVLIQAFTLTFLAEWGDRSQMATIAMAAVRNPIGVTLGGVAGHFICTGVACLGGKVFASKVSERAVNICGGILFIIFGVSGALVAP